MKGTGKEGVHRFDYKNIKKLCMSGGREEMQQLVEVPSGDDRAPKKGGGKLSIKF